MKLIFTKFYECESCGHVAYEFDCPRCGSGATPSFHGSINDEIKEVGDEFQCTCGTIFIAIKITGGHIINSDDWLWRIREG